MIRIQNSILHTNHVLLALGRCILKPFRGIFKSILVSVYMVVGRVCTLSIVVFHFCNLLGCLRLALHKPLPHCPTTEMHAQVLAPDPPSSGAILKGRWSVIPEHCSLRRVHPPQGVHPSSDLCDGLVSQQKHRNFASLTTVQKHGFSP